MSKMSTLDAAIQEMKDAKVGLANAKALYAEKAKAVAEAACPFKVGQVVYSNRGLGRDGLQIFEIVPTLNMMDGNLWSINSYALTKAGEVSRRIVGTDQSQAEADGMRSTREPAES